MATAGALDVMTVTTMMVRRCDDVANRQFVCTLRRDADDSHGSPIEWAQIWVII